MSHSVRQVYYIFYPSIHPCKWGCCVVIKSKWMCHIETDDPMEDDVYQDGDILPINEVIEIE